MCLPGCEAANLGRLLSMACGPGDNNGSGSVTPESPDEPCGTCGEVMPMDRKGRVPKHGKVREARTIWCPGGGREANPYA